MTILRRDDPKDAAGSRPRGWRLKAYFALLVLVFGIAAAGAAVFVFVQSERDGRREAERNARFTARTAADEVGQAVSILRSTVEGLAAQPNVAQTFKRPQDCALTFGVTGGIESGHVDVLRNDGSVACSSRQPEGSTPLAGYRGEDWLERAKDGAIFEAPVVDAAAGGHAALSAAPIQGGVIAAFIALEPAGPGLSELYGGGRPLELLLTSADGRTVIVRSIEADRWVGRSIADTEFSRDRGSAERTDLDGRSRLYAEAEVPNAGWRLFVGEDMETALAAGNRLRNRQLAIILVGLALVLAATFLVYRRVVLPMKRLGEAVLVSSRQSPPQPVPVAGPAEVAALGSDVNELIAAVGERDRLEHQLRQAQRMEAIGRLAGGIAHDFNNLLAAVIGYSELLLGRTPPGDPRRSDTEQIKSAGERAAALTRQLLTFGRRQAIEPVVLDLNDAIRALEPMLRRLIRADVEFTIALAPGPARVRADRSQIEQVLVNLAVNAGDAMADGGRLTIATSTTTLDEEYFRLHPAERGEPGAYVMLDVSDTGVGMDEDTKSRIFEPFFTTKPPERGTGLGLATVYGIVRQSDGFVWAYSELGQGTTFKVYLPAVDAPVEPPAERDARPLPAARGRTVLLVEDDAPVRAVVRLMLESQGLTVLEAGEGDRALRVSDEAAPDSVHVLVADTVIPGPGGIELARRVRSRHPGLRTLIMSGYSEALATRDVALEPGTEFIAKPFTQADLNGKLAVLLGFAPAA